MWFAVDRDAALPTRFAHAQVVLHHARLGQRERGEHAYRVQGDQRVGFATEHDDEHTCQRGQHDHAVREHEAVTAVRELTGQVTVSGDDRRQPGEVGVRGVRRERENAGGRELQVFLLGTGERTADEQSFQRVEHDGSRLRSRPLATACTRAIRARAALSMPLCCHQTPLWCDKPETLQQPDGRGMRSGGPGP